jgi:protein ImuB
MEGPVRLPSPTVRLVTVWCADWPVVAARVPLDEPAAVFHANRVVARTPAAAAAGVHAGDRRRSAQRACPTLAVLEHDPHRDGREFEPVVRAVAEMAPRVEVVEPGWLCLAARGPSRYFGGDALLADRMIDAVLGITGVGAAVGVGIAEGRAASCIAARRAARTAAGTMVVAAGEARAFLEPLPVAWLRLLGEATPELVDLFARLGLRTFGALACLDAGDVLSRFGPEGLHAHRIASAADERPTAAVDPPPEWWCEHAFPEPIEQLETVVFIAKRLADDLVARLAAEGRVCTRLVVMVETEHGERSERVWYRDHGLAAMAMVERVRWQLEGWAAQPGGLSGGVALLRFMPDEVRSDDGVQPGLWGGRSRADADAARAVIRLSGIAGDQAVRVPSWNGGRLPGERYRLVPAASADLEGSDDRLDRGEGPWPGATVTPSPTVVYPEAVPAELFGPRGDTVVVSGRGEVSSAPSEILVGATRHQVVAWAGPWPVEQRWWVPGEARRMARLQVVTDQGVAYLIGVEQQRWSVLARYD